MQRPSSATSWLEEIALDPGQPLPLYEQLARAIRAAIIDGRLPAGAALPPEPALAELLGVSRQTVNQALSQLAQRGLLTRRRGVGTFVAEPAIEQSLSGLYSFVRTLVAQGHRPGTRHLGFRLTIDEHASPLLTGRRDGLVLEISRLRLVDGDPFVVETIFLPEACERCLSREKLEQAALYDVLASECGIVVTAADETLRPVTLEQTEAALLGLAPGDPAFLVERIGYAHDQPVEMRISLIRGDRYRFRVHLEGPALTGVPGS